MSNLGFSTLEHAGSTDTENIEINWLDFGVFLDYIVCES